MDNEATLVMKTYIVHKVALTSREEEEQMYEEDGSCKQRRLFHAGASPTETGGVTEWAVNISIPL